MSEITLDSRIKAGPRQVSCQIDGEAALLHLDQGVYYGLNKVGARVWQLVQEGSTLTDLRAAICREYEIDEAQCERDLRELIEGLLEAELVVVETTATGAT